jgi:hypothetical protein
MPIPPRPPLLLRRHRLPGSLHLRLGRPEALVEPPWHRRHDRGVRRTSRR